MKRAALALGALALAATAVPLTDILFGADEAQAQERRQRGKPAAAAAPASGAARGMAEAPALLQAAGVSCAVSEANFLGQSKSGETIYEVACSDGPGWILIASADKTPKQTFECVQLRDGNAANAAAGQDTKNALSCKLPGNQDMVANLARKLTPLVPGCQADQARWLGASAQTRENIYELGCAGTPGAIIRVAAPGGTTQPSVIQCVKIGPEANAQCEFTTREEKSGAVQGLVKASTKPTCQVADMRHVGTSGTTKEEFFEVKCGSGEGFMVVANANGSFNRIIECSRAQGVSGGCTLTDAVAAQTAEAALYAGLAKKAGFNCDVGQYRLLGMETTSKREVVELQCKNQPEGVIAFFPAGAGGRTDIYDCTKNWRHRQTCSLTKLDQIKPRLQRDLAKFNKTCDVTGFRGAGMTTKAKTEFVEVSCASGPGLMIEYAAEGAPLFAPATGVFTCAEAANIGEGCKLGAPARRS